MLFGKCPRFYQTLPWLASPYRIDCAECNRFLRFEDESDGKET